MHHLTPRASTRAVRCLVLCLAALIGLLSLAGLTIPRHSVATEH
jgi:hypothetical protein